MIPHTQKDPAQPKQKRGIFTIEALRERSTFDPATMCWHWLGAMSAGQPRIWTIDYEKKTKATMTGPRAVWNIAHCCPPTRGFLVFRRCLTSDCVNPAHMRLARNKAEIYAHIKRSGKLKGTFVEARRANIRQAWAANGTVPTPEAIVLAVRSEPKGATRSELAAKYDISVSVVSRIVRGQSHKGIGMCAVEFVE